MQPGGKWEGKQLSSRDKKLYRALQLTPEEIEADRLTDMTNANLEQLLYAIEVNRNRPAVQRELQGIHAKIMADRESAAVQAMIAPSPTQLSQPMDAPSILDRIMNFSR